MIITKWRLRLQFSHVQSTTISVIGAEWRIVNHWKKWSNFFCKNFNFPGVFSKQKVKAYTEDFLLLLMVSFLWLVKTILSNLQNSGRCLMWSSLWWGAGLFNAKGILVNVIIHLLLSVSLGYFKQIWSDPYLWRLLCL